MQSSDKETRSKADLENTPQFSRQRYIQSATLRSEAAHIGVFASSRIVRQHGAISQSVLVQ